MKEEEKKFLKYTIESVTQEQLRNIKYHNLGEALNSLGIKEVWKSGVKKDVMLKKAWNKILIRREQIEKGMTEEQIEIDNKLREEVKAGNRLAAKKSEELAIEREAKEVVEEVAKKEYTEEQVRKTIERLEFSTSIKTKSPFRRSQGLKKLRKWKMILEEILKNKA